MNNLLGIIISILFVFLIIGISTLLTRKNILKDEGSRKFIHIGVSNWWILAMIFFDNNIYASIVPALFIVLNYLSYRKNLFTAMERGGDKEDLGTVYYAISLFILSILTFKDINYAYIGALGILTMGYGDGLAAVIGKRYGRKKYKIFGSTKSLIGSLTMFVVTFIVNLIILSIYNPTNIIIYSFVLAVFATLLELFTPKGFDNLSVPLGSSLIYYILAYL
ncbi:MAG: phosphatidate cytidylyltransferase [Tissierellales bacterium]|nr:phosphatidate cytidylyltransferase [Tissierellales bacterium]